jgi:hypothetical protein
LRQRRSAQRSRRSMVRMGWADLDRERCYSVLLRQLQSSMIGEAAGRHAGQPAVAEKTRMVVGRHDGRGGIALPQGKDQLRRSRYCRRGHYFPGSSVLVIDHSLGLNGAFDTESKAPWSSSRAEWFRQHPTRPTGTRREQARSDQHRPFRRGASGSSSKRSKLSNPSSGSTEQGRYPGSWSSRLSDRAERRRGTWRAARRRAWPPRPAGQTPPRRVGSASRELRVAERAGEGTSRQPHAALVGVGRTRTASLPEPQGSSAPCRSRKWCVSAEAGTRAERDGGAACGDSRPRP